MSCPVSPISSINSIAPHSRPHSPCIHQFPPASALYQLAGKSNFQLWLSAIKPYLFSNPESTGLILGGWTEPKASNDAVGTTWTRERWIAANTETCRFIRGTLAMNVIPHVRQHNTAKGLWHNLLWLYGEEAGIDTQGGPPVPRVGDDVYGSQRGGGGGGGGGRRAKLLAAMAKKTTSIELDLDLEMGRGDKVVSPLHSPPLMPVIKASGSGASSHSFGPFLEVPSFDGPEDEDEDDYEDDYEEEDYESDDEFSRVPPQFILAYNARSQTTSSATSATTTAAPTTLKHFTINKGMSDEVVDHHPATTSHNPLRNRGKPSSSTSSASSSTPGASLNTIQEESHHDPHPGRRVDLSDSSVLIRRRSIFDAIPYLGTRDDRRASSSDDADAFDGHSVGRRKRGGIVFQRWFNTGKRASGGGGGGGDGAGRDRLSLSSPVLLRRLNVGSGGGGGSRDRKRDGVADWKGKGKAVQM